jgi:Transport and Golgi organisation 2
MCSVSFLPREDGFVLAMNRDESLSRVSALPPELFKRNGLAMLYPRELSGGTWIGVNRAGMAFSLINWYSEPDCANVNPVSRGEVVRALLSARNSAGAASLLRKLPLNRMNPFRLMVVSPSERSLTEWRSSGSDLEPFILPWTRQHWFSSAFDEGKANEMRRRVCARVHGDSFGLSSLRRLHRSHAPKAGPFSLCMHRNDACTVSYTEINVHGPVASVYYVAGPPCSRSPRFKASLELEITGALRKVA